MKASESRVADRPYLLMPFRFLRFPESQDQYLAVSDSGEHLFLSAQELERFVTHKLHPDEPLYSKLESRHFLVEHGREPLEILSANRLKTRFSHINDGPGLHLLVTTLRCDHGCPYCQVSRQVSNASPAQFDMSLEVANAAVDRIFETNGRELTVEFQGGEPLLAPDVVRAVIEKVAKRASAEGRHVRYVVCSTLHHLSDSLLDLFATHGVVLSTSLDGPRDLHDQNRPCAGGSYDKTVRAIERARTRLGADSVSALTTITRASLPRLREVVDEYVRLGFREIALRPLSPYGFAARSVRHLGYSEHEFDVAYADALNYIVELNVRGVPLVETYATLLLQKVLSPFPAGYVDLRSPTGAGLGALVYNYDGYVYPSDESRMLAEMRIDDLRLGRVSEPLPQLLSSSAAKLLEEWGVAEALPGCADCAFVPYCGADPVERLLTMRTNRGTRVSGKFCQRHTRAFWTIFRLLRDATPATMGVLLSWLRPCGCSLTTYSGYMAA
jgi:His-Xaa-Ser system radical SAM maturase HxsB